MRSEPEIRTEWLALMHSTAAADRPLAETAVRDLYTAAGFAAPRHIIWFDSPCAASWAVAALVAPYHNLWAENLASGALSGGDRQRLDAAKSSLGKHLGASDWKGALLTAGPPLGMHLQYPPDPTRILQSRVVEARVGLSDDLTWMFSVPDDGDDLFRAEQRFWGSNKGVLPSALHCPTTEAFIGHSFYEDYSFRTMADDERQAGDREPPAILAAAWDVARSSGMWWPFENIAMLTERPVELHVDDRKLLHAPDGPAAVYRDGWRVYAWRGMALPERWVLEPETIAPRELKQFDAEFRRHVESKVARSAGRTSSKPAKSARIAFLERYQAGECVQVWADLVALGPEVRRDLHAEAALAVARETMRRVKTNVQTIVERLRAMKYAFSRQAGSPYSPPAAGVQQAIADLEKSAGALPLSLRVFYEVVGEVNLIGNHPTLAPRNGRIAPDPLVVFGFDAGLVEYDDDDEEGDERAAALIIAPDDLHKADTSGGDAYEIAIPDLRADSELLNERHSLFFVDYLRLCFRYGGFPGYDGAGQVPAEIEDLRAGLIDF